MKNSTKTYITIAVVFLAVIFAAYRKPIVRVAAQTVHTAALELNNTFTGTNTFNGTLNVTGLGNVSQKAASGDAVRYVSSTGSDSNNDGLSPGTAKATIAAAYATLPTCTPVPSFGFGVTPTAPCGAIYLASENASAGYTLSSPLTINGLMVRIIGEGKNSTVINCTTSPCITFNNEAPYAFAPTMSTDAGLFSLTLKGNGSASQIGVLGLTADGMEIHDTRMEGFSGAGAYCLKLLNDGSGGITERTDFDNLAFDNCNGILMTTSGISPNTSFGHNSWKHMQWSLSPNQVAVTLGGVAGFYASYVDGVVNATSATGTANEFSISGSAAVRSRWDVAIDNGGGTTINVCTVGCTNANLQLWGFFANPGSLSTQDFPITINNTVGSAFNSFIFQNNSTPKIYEALDGNNALGLYNATPTEEAYLSQQGLFATTGLGQIAANSYAGACTMSSATTCTRPVTASYIGGAPLCLVNDSSTSAMVLASCAWSGGTVTVTALSSNSHTFNFALIGNPN